MTRAPRRFVCSHHKGMKQYIQDIIDDMRNKKDRDFIPPSPVKGVKTIDLEPHAEPALPTDLDDQILSSNPLEETRQLDFQAQQDEERETTE
jgi:hypothetical protein